MLRREFEPGTRERSFRMNEDINTDGIKASFENGVLTVVLPIVQPVAPRQIPVSTR
ncbi:MAG: Hsp20/alpha crystallin family protein [Rubripirellula sp.]